MKNSRTIIIILSLLLLTLSSGLLFYRSLFELDNQTFQTQIDLEELRSLDSKLTQLILISKKNLNLDLTLFETDAARIKELLNLLQDLEKESNVFETKINSIKNHYDQKLNLFSKYKDSLKSLKNSTNDLSSSFYEIQKNHFKFPLDGKEFYPQCMIDIMLYMNTGNTVYENKINDNLKILNQITVFSKKPNTTLEKFYKSIDQIMSKSKEIDVIILQMTKPNQINNDVSVLNRFLKDNQIASSKKGETFLYLVFSAIVFYLIAIFLLVAKKR